MTFRLLQACNGGLQMQQPECLLSRGRCFAFIPTHGSCKEDKLLMCVGAVAVCFRGMFRTVFEGSGRGIRGHLQSLCRHLQFKGLVTA
jgi:hypothetical protein